jgi:hypothetical protein
MSELSTVPFDGEGEETEWISDWTENGHSFWAPAEGWGQQSPSRLPLKVLR